ncbi:MAG: GAF domain-containing protein [Gammaproteobacteria bacterium]|nr:GAF domain-containing protein [Gammaproteobacteria bacterium]
MIANYENLLNRVHLLNSIGISLSTEKDSDRLLEKILLGAKELTNADGGTIYLINDHKELEMVIVRTDSLNYAMGGSTGISIPFDSIPLYLADSTPNKQMVVTSAVLNDQTINIADAYDANGYDFTGTYDFDKKTGYRSTSFLTIPMKNHENDIIGVLQLINARSEDNTSIQPFSNEDQQLAESLASQAAVALTNKQLIDGMKELFDSLVKMIASTIDEKSAHTGSHCRRIPVITMMIAHAVNNTSDGYFSDYRISEDDLYQLETAAWLHDCGKLTTPDRVMEKSTKLEMPIDRIELIKLRFEILKRDLNVTSHTTTNTAPNPSEAEEIDSTLEHIINTNKGGEYTDSEAIEKILRFAEKYNIIIGGAPQPILTEDEIHHLSINKGTITDEERKMINNHINVTINMLESLPFPKHLMSIPEYAGGHHERIDGKGFPKGLTRDEMSVPARIMAIADIFEALTANDRPYKSPMKLSKALDILDNMQKTGHIDPDIYDVFIQKKVYLQYAKEYLSDEQIDID